MKKEWLYYRAYAYKEDPKGGYTVHQTFEKSPGHYDVSPSEIGHADDEAGAKKLIDERMSFFC